MTHRPRRPRKDDQAFTMLELSVVVLIVAVLVAIAVPTFVGTRGRARQQAAQSDLRAALAVEERIHGDTGAYTDAVDDLAAAEPGIRWVAGEPEAGEVQVLVGADGTVCLNATSADGEAYAVAGVAAGEAAGEAAGTYHFRAALAAADCTAGNVSATGSRAGF